MTTGTRRTRGRPCRLSRWPPSCSCWGTSSTVTGSSTIRHQSPCSRHIPGAAWTPSPLWVVHGWPAFSMACATVRGCDEWAVVLLLPAGPVPDADECPVPEVVRMANVPHNPLFAEGRWNWALWWCTSDRRAPQRCAGQRIPQPLSHQVCLRVRCGLAAACAVSAQIYPLPGAQGL